MSNLRAQRALVDLGRNIKQARLARRLAMLDLAERAGVSEKTIQRLERGDAGVGIGKLAGVLAALGEPDALAEILRIEVRSGNCGSTNSFVSPTEYQR